MPGAPVAEAVFADLVPRIEKLRENGHTPGLGTLLVGDDDASARYVGMKQRKAEELGCVSPHVHLPADATQDAVVAAIQKGVASGANTSPSTAKIAGGKPADAV